MAQNHPDDWKSNNFRQNIAQKIGEILRQGNMLSSNARTNPTSLENHIFSKSNSREEYLQYATKLLTHFRSQVNAKNNQMQQQQQQHKQEVEMAGGPPNMIQDPINALQNLASQGSRPVNTGQIPGAAGQMQQGVPMQGGPNNINNASNLLQSLNQQRPGPQPQPNQQMQAMRGQMGGQQMLNVAPNQMSMNNMNMMGQQQPQQHQMQMQNQMGAGGMNQMQMNQMNINQMNPMMANRMGNQPNMNVGAGLGNQIQMQGNMGSIPSQGPGLMGNAGIVPQVPQAGGNMQQMMSMQQKQQTNMGIPQQGNMYRVNPNTGQNFLPQSPSQNVPSPAQQIPNQPPQLPNPQMIPSPALVPTSSPQMPMMPGNQRVLMQSPSQPLNTPGQPAQSPYNAQEDIIYREKYKQLTKYIDPLQKMVAKIGNDESEKIAKMNRLLEILLNPQQRIPLETLLKCEKALERMDILGGAPSNKHHFLETVNTVLQTPTGHHTLYRTFHPSYESLFGSDIKMSSPAPKKRSVAVEETQDTPHVLQGEIARLDQKFKVTLDPATQNQNKTLTLNCCLDDKCLPWVPPICITIPENYPFNSPTCTLNKQEYTATPFLTSVEKSLASRIGKLPKLHSLSHILDTWEMSVRQACSPTSAVMTADDVLADILAF